MKHWTVGDRRSISGLQHHNWIVTGESIYDLDVSIPIELSTASPCFFSKLG